MRPAIREYLQLVGAVPLLLTLLLMCALVWLAGLLVPNTEDEYHDPF